MKKGFKVLCTLSLAAVAGVLSLSVNADEIDAQKAYVENQAKQGAKADVKYEGLDAQKKALFAQLDQYVDRAHADKAAQEALFEQQRINNITADARNYASYLQARVSIVAENTRVKKEIFDNYTGLSASNPQFAALVPAALADYQKALMDQYNAQAIADSAKAFANGPLIAGCAKQALSWYSGPQDAGRFVMSSIGISTVY